MPPTTRAMTGRGETAPATYATRQPRSRGPTAAPRPRFRPRPAATKTMHGEIGFDRAELQDSGSLESPAAKSPTLANDIHRFFSKDKFIFDDGLPPYWDEAYEAMMPAFRLVSRWLTDPRFRKFWNCLSFGEVRQVDQGNSLRGHDLSYEIELENPGADRLAEFEDMFPDTIDGCAVDHHYQFRPVADAWAESRSQTTPNGRRPTRWPFTSMTFLHEDFLLLSHTTFPAASKSKQVRFLFFLAVNLAHELAHVLWHYHWSLENNNADQKSILKWEPFFMNIKEPHDELGIAWEYFMFGGRIQPLNHTKTPFVPDGLVILPLDMVQERSYTSPLCQIAPLLTEWISDQFSENWWTKRSKKAARARLPGHPRRAPIRATVNRTTNSDVFVTNAYRNGEDSQFVANHVAGGCDGHRLVTSADTSWLFGGVVDSMWTRDSDDEES
ncbi:hypothetical protein MMC07_009487 [Pseudocyphellaria aurata]|nr:hypothetical protein [Pseudocyphellaria aurata]